MDAEPTDAAAATARTGARHRSVIGRAESRLDDFVNREDLMRSGTSSFAVAAVFAAAVFGLAVILLVTAGITEALVLVAIAGALSGMYALRNWARAELIRRPPSAPTASRAPERQQEHLSSPPRAGQPSMSGRG